jgi:hypothetical protein
VTSGKKCLGVAQATQDATISIVTCDSTKECQVWQLGH